MLIKEDVEPDLDALRSEIARMGYGRKKSESERAHLDRLKKTSTSTLLSTLRKGYNVEFQGKDDKMIHCVRCGENSIDDGILDHCPFCGDEGVEAETDVEVDLSSEVDDPVDEDDRDDDFEDDEDDEEIEPDEDEDEDDIEFEEPETVDVSKADVPSTSVVPALSNQPIKLADDIQGLTEQANLCQGTFSRAFYDLGCILLKVKESHMYRDLNYKTFREYTEAELNLKRSQALSFMNIASEFDRKTFLEIGPTKLAVLAKVPQKNRAPLLEKARKGASVEVLKEEVKLVKKAVDRPVPEKDPNAERKEAVPDTIHINASVSTRAKTVGFTTPEGEDLPTYKQNSILRIPIGSSVDVVIAFNRDAEGVIVNASTIFQKRD